MQDKVRYIQSRFLWGHNIVGDNWPWTADSKTGSHELKLFQKTWNLSKCTKIWKKKESGGWKLVSPEISQRLSHSWCKKTATHLPEEGEEFFCDCFWSQQKPDLFLNKISSGVILHSVLFTCIIDVNHTAHRSVLEGVTLRYFLA